VQGFDTTASDATILFNRKNLDQWVSTADRNKKAEYKVSNNMITVDKTKGNIETKQVFGNYQLHVEWLEPMILTGTGQQRGNSGIFWIRIKTIRTLTGRQEAFINNLFL